MKPALKVVGLGNRAVDTPVRDSKVPLRWQNVDKPVHRNLPSERTLNTGYRYPGSTWESMMLDSSLGD